MKRKRRDSNPHDRFILKTHKLYEQQEIVDPILLPPAGSQRRYSVPLTHIPQERWEEVAQRYACDESLRLLAKHYGVSHEAVRQILKR
jgi:hypothetical protein